MKAEEKRGRLTEAAKALIYQQGLQRTTLAEIAEAAHVPLGNVYYHFRTKESLVEAVIEAHLRDVRERFAQLDREPDPLKRLKAFVRSGLLAGDQLARYGCPYGTLCEELGKSDTQLAEAASSIFRLYLDWVERQFRLLDKGDEAAELAVDLVSSIQGMFVLTASLRSTELLERKIARLERWLDTAV